MSTATPLPLEAWLERHESATHKFPTDGVSYFQRYLGLKQQVAAQYSQWTGAGAAANEGGMLLTSHGPDHVNKVIKTLGRLLSGDEDCLADDIKLQPYEVYVALCAIVLHDAGNAMGRKEHEKKPFSILSSLEGLMDDRFEERFIADIASSHGGKIDGDKDTIGILRDNQINKGIRFRPKVIAALIRFSDEICEDKDRAAPALLNQGAIPRESIIPHKYANSIQSSSPDLGDKSVYIEYQLMRSDVENLLPCEPEKYLIDVIFERLDKMNIERIYCMRYMYPASEINRIRARIDIVDDESYKSIELLDVEVGDGGYPNPANVPSIAEKYNSFCGARLREKISSMAETG